MSISVCTVGQLFSWGCNSAGQLGIGLPVITNTDTAGNSRQPKSDVSTSPLVHCVDSLRGVAIAHVAAGSQHSASLSVSGALFMWGFNRCASTLALCLLCCIFNIGSNTDTGTMFVVWSSSQSYSESLPSSTEES